jgi:thiamine-phosphate pyrophosphorylase
MKLAVLTSDRNVNGELNIIHSLFQQGMELLHVRKPQFSSSDYLSFIGQIQPAYHNRIVIHGGYHLFGRFDLSGIHLSSYQRGDALAIEATRHIPRSRVSTSFHSWQEILDATDEYRYVFISPVFNSISKPGYEAAIDRTGIADLRLRVVRQGRDCPGIFGLGGVGPQQIPLLQESGFDGAAVLGSIWHAPDPLAAFTALKNQLR